MAKVESIGVAMILKTGIKVAQYYTVLKYGPLRPQNNVKSQDRTIVSDTGVDLETTTFLPGNSKEKVGKEIPPYVLLMDYSEISLATTVYKARGNTYSPFWRGS